MSDGVKKTVGELRKEAVATHDERSEKIFNWAKEHGGVHHRVSRYKTRATPENVQKLIDLISGALEASVRPDASILISVMAYLQKYDPTNTDEAGRDTGGFSLALSEIDVALTHLDDSQEKALRYLAYRYKSKMYPDESRVVDFPTILYVESALACNLMCTMCYQSDKKLVEVIRSTEKKVMDWDLYQKVIDEGAENGLCAVVFAGRGEPTLNKNFTQMLRYADDKGVLDIKINTNATRLTEQMVRDWLSIGAPLTVVFSVDAADKEGFEAIRLGANFDEVIANIKMFDRIRSEEFPDSPVRTRISMTLFQDSQDPEAARNLWGSLVDEFTAKNARGEQSGSIYQTGIGGQPKNLNPGKKCRVLFDRLYIWCDGKVNPCEDDYLSTLQLGNAYTHTLKSLWGSKEMNTMRIRHMTGCKNKISPCNGCNGY
ncbi:MAG: radical SAM protein [bacterium]|nr:radical SAM protein [bacterium]